MRKSANDTAKNGRAWPSEVSELIDEKWYLDFYPDVASAGISPIEHYMSVGWAEGRNPSPHFDTEEYLRRCPDVELSGANPLLHYVAHRLSEDSESTRSGDATHNNAENLHMNDLDQSEDVVVVLDSFIAGRIAGRVLNSGAIASTPDVSLQLFGISIPRAAPDEQSTNIAEALNSDAQVSFVTDALLAGPQALTLLRQYLQDVMQGAMLQDRDLSVKVNGRNVVWRMGNEATFSQNVCVDFLDLISTVENEADSFDPERYRSQIERENADDWTLLVHYVRAGAKAPAEPAQIANIRLARDSLEVDQAGPHLDAQTAGWGVTSESSYPLPHPDRAAILGRFDAEFYLRGFAENERPSDPASHFLYEGSQQGRDPAPWFSVWHYLAIHPDVAAAGINAFLHYCLSGESEGRTLARLGQQTHMRDGQANLFGQMFEVTTGGRSPMFAPLTQRTAPSRSSTPRAIAFYLPQFHPFKENDTWWGKGFTEWTNVSKAVPQFSGHNQPRLPGELGHYDLRLPEIMQRQIELARQFGIEGFCFHYYWFSGHRLLEKPLDMFLSRKDKDFDFPFCLCWANENWTRRWDGAEHDVLMQQSHDPADHLAVINDLLRYMKDPRYIKVNNQPVVVVYRPSIIGDLDEMVSIWRRRAREEGFDGIFLIATNAFGFSGHTDIGFDGLCEFPPHNVVASDASKNYALFNPAFEGKIYEYAEARDFSLARLEQISSEPGRDRYFPTVMLGWDNEARKPGRGNVFVGADPRKFYDWFLGALRYSKEVHAPDARLVFINAWNEWGEGTYLEPDRWFGYAYLNAVAAAYDTLSTQRVTEVRPTIPSDTDQSKRSVILLHAFYHDLLPELAERLSRPWIRDQFDVVTTVPPHWTYQQMQDAFDVLGAKTVLVTPNVGRDMFPFMQALEAIDLSQYDIALKLHTKKSPHLQHGARWGQAILDSLTGEREVADVLSAFAKDPALGLMAPQSMMMPLDDAASLRDNRDNLDQIVQRYSLKIAPDATFVAGSMFWFRPAAFESLRASPLSLDDFGPELGAIDGTMAHALERLLPRFVDQAGFTTRAYRSDAEFNPYL